MTTPAPKASEIMTSHHSRQHRVGDRHRPLHDRPVAPVRIAFRPCKLLNLAEPRQIEIPPTRQAGAAEGQASI